jgi:hypothetical protein
MIDIIPIDALKAFVAMQPSGPKAGAQVGDSIYPRLLDPHRGDFDIQKWAEEHGVPVEKWKPFADGGTVGVLAMCPWNPGHTNQSAYIGQFANGDPFAGCHHNSCSEKGWPEIRDVYEPGWRETRAEIKPIEAVQDPHRLARNILESEYSHPDGSILRYHRGGIYLWEGSAYRELAERDLVIRLANSIKREFD